MPSALGGVLSYFRRLAPRRAAGPEEDSQLLSRFLQGDEEAFAALVGRYAPLVWGVCKRLLGATPDAEDAFQATFVVCARKASSLADGRPVGPWLYKVAHDTAARARARSARRRSHEVPLQVEPLGTDPPHLQRLEVIAALEEELGRLPERYRRPVVLCYLEGLTNEEAARRLGCPKGTILSRLSRARERLRDRLARRGVDLSGAVYPAALAAEPVPAALVEVVVKGGGLSTSVTSLAKGVLVAMSIRKVGVVVAALLLVALTASAGAWMRFRRVEPGVTRAMSRPNQEHRRAAPAGGEKKAPAALVYRVTTDLQRDFMSRADVFVLLDASEAAKGGKASPEALKLEDLRKSLPKEKKGNGRLAFTLFFQSGHRGNPRAQELLRYTMIGFGYWEGFSPVSAWVTVTNSDATWDEFIKVFRGKGDKEAKAAEPATTHRLVKAYPVRTEFSRYLTSGADCAVVLEPGVAKGADAVPEEVRKAITVVLGKLKLAPKKKVSFYVTPGEVVMIKQELINDFFALAKELGYEPGAVGSRPG